MKRHCVVASPLGELQLFVEGGAVCGLRFAVAGEPGGGAVAAPDGLEREAAWQLGEYFGGSRSRFDLPLRARGSAFAQAVWQQLGQLRYGERISYAALAARLGLASGSSRAVARAVAANPLLVLLPCHRVIGSDGALRGYAGGIERKRWLLQLETGGGPPAQAG